MKSEKISQIVDFSPGRIVYENFSIEQDQEWIDQLDKLDEDLLQVEFPDDVILDLGWYPAFSRKGQFQVRVIRDFNWDAPIFYAEVTQLAVLRTVLEAARRTAIEASFVTA